MAGQLGRRAFAPALCVCVKHALMPNSAFIIYTNSKDLKPIQKNTLLSSCLYYLKVMHPLENYFHDVTSL